jgi:hypothetical protein
MNTSIPMVSEPDCGMLSKSQKGAIAAMLGLALGLAWLDGQSLHSATPYQKHNRAAEEPKNGGPKVGADERIADYTWWLAILTGALVAVSLGQGFFLLRSDETARMAAAAALKSADTAEKDLLASHRPLITISNLKLRQPPNGQYDIAFGLRNSGKGFAAVNKIGVTIQTVDSNHVQRIRFVSAEWNGAIEAGDLIDGNSVASEIIGQNEHYLIINGRMTLLVNFEILSQDIFHNDIRQVFSFVYNFRASHFERAPSKWIQEAKGED